MRMADEQGVARRTTAADILTTREELRLLKLLWLFPDIILFTAESYEPHKLAVYLTELAEAFHKFYTVCRIIGQEQPLAESRLALSIAVKTVLKNGMSILGVTAPERM
jgi:arginyl-tRNA synthetase